MSSIRVEVTAEDCTMAGPWPRHASSAAGWKSPVELALIRLSGVDVDVDGDEDVWHATIGTMASPTLVVDLPEPVKERLDSYWGQQGALMEPFAFDIEIDDWLVALIAPEEAYLAAFGRFAYGQPAAAGDARLLLEHRAPDGGYRVPPIVDPTVPIPTTELAQPNPTDAEQRHERLLHGEASPS